MINRENVIKYGRLVTKIMSDGSYKLTDDDNMILRYMKDLIKENPEYADLAEKIIDVNGNEEQVQQILDSYEKENNNEEKNEEEQIAEAFNISVNDIEHLYLNGGKKIFHFYSNELGRDVVLENAKDGKNLEEVLKELKSQDTEDKNSEMETDSTDLLMADSRVGNLEMNMYSPEQIINNKDITQLINENDLLLIKYLVSNAERLDIKLINLDNLFYITNDHKIKEITFDKDFKPVVSDPEHERNLDDSNINEDMGLETTETEEMEDNSDLDNMLSDTTEEDQKKEEERNELGNKSKVLRLENTDNSGFANNNFFILSVMLIIIILVVIILILR